MPPDAPVLINNSIVDRRKRKDLTPLQRLFAIDQSLRNLEHSEDGKVEMNGKLISCTSGCHKKVGYNSPR